MSPRKQPAQRGSYLLLMAILSIVFLGLCGLIFGSAILASSRVRLKNLANITALTALNGYLSESDPDPDKKSAKALESVAAILSKNSIPNSRAGHLDSVSIFPDVSGNSGYLRLGRWFPVLPTCIGCGDPCTGAYPCFKDSSTGDPVNAVQAILKTGTDNPIIAPTQVLGGTEFFVSEKSIASLIPRCVEFVLDVSSSTVEQTHGGIATTPPGYLAFRVIDWNGGNAWDNPDDAASEGIFRSCPAEQPDDKDTWCTPDLTFGPLPIKQDRSTYPLPGANDHFQDDYVYVRTPIGTPDLGPRKFMIDAWSFTNGNPPEPLTTFLRAFNAGAREISEQSSSGDAIGVMAFSEGIVSDTGMSSAVDLMRQLTNIRNAFPGGGDPALHPNFVDWNWFPRAGDIGSNMTQALEQAYNQLINPTVCPAFAKKIIILATDGLVNSIDTSKLPPDSCVDGDPDDQSTWECLAISQVYPGTIAAPCLPCDGVNGFTLGRYHPVGGFIGYALAEQQIMDQNTGILQQLSNAGIAVTVLMSGQQTGPNFMNHTGPDAKFINPEDAGTLGWDGLPYGSGTFSPFVRWTAAMSQNTDLATANAADSVAFASRYTTPFYRPNGLLAELAFRTGGIFCPLLTPGAEGRYVDVDGSGIKYMTETERAAEGGTQLHSITYRSITEQARDCVSKAIGANPYALQEEWSPAP